MQCSLTCSSGTQLACSARAHLQFAGACCLHAPVILSQPVLTCCPAPGSPPCSTPPGTLVYLRWRWGEPSLHQVQHQQPRVGHTQSLSASMVLWNRCRKRGRIFFIPDPAHFLKKAVNNLEKSWVANGTLEMWIPKILVDVILKQVSSLLLVLVHVLIPIAHVVTLVLIPVQASDLPNELVQVFADQANSWNNRPPPPGQQLAERN